MATPRKGWLPREGFTIDVVLTLLKQTLLNPTLTLPLWLLTRYSNRGRGYALDNPAAVRRLRLLLIIGVVRYINNVFNRLAQNNWRSARPDWKRELVLVTGGSEGIGKLLVQKFEARGVRVVFFDVQDPTYKPKYADTHFVKVDLTDSDALKAACDQVKQQYGNPSVLVLNAGITNRHSIIDTPDAALKRIFDLNVLSQYRLLREFLPSMIRANHGMVCTTASLAGWVTVAGMVDYNSTKAAVISLHEGLTSELATWYNAPAVRTICICPNFVRTKLSDGFYNDSKFFTPNLHAETVAEIEFDRIWNWEGGMVPIPNSQSNVALSGRSWPYWLQNTLRNGLHKTMRGVAEAEQARIRSLKAKSATGDHSSVSDSVVQIDKPVEAKTAIFA